MIKAVLILFSLFLYTFPISAEAQDVNAILRQAESLEKAFKDQEALNKYLEVLKYSPAHITAICKVSELYSTGW